MYLYNGRQREPWNLVLWHSVSINIFPFIFSVKFWSHCVLCERAQRHSIAQRRSENIKHFISSSYFLTSINYYRLPKKKSKILITNKFQAPTHITPNIYIKWNKQTNQQTKKIPTNCNTRTNSVWLKEHECGLSFRETSQTRMPRG